MRQKLKIHLFKRCSPTNNRHNSGVFGGGLGGHVDAALSQRREKPGRPPTPRPPPPRASLPPALPCPAPVPQAGGEEGPPGPGGGPGRGRPPGVAPPPADFVRRRRGMKNTIQVSFECFLHWFTIFFLSTFHADDCEGGGVCEPHAGGGSHRKHTRPVYQVLLL